MILVKILVWLSIEVAVVVVVQVSNFVETAVIVLVGAELVAVRVSV